MGKGRPSRVDVLVVGAGPAGSSAARECARRGLSVLLVDKAAFPRGKVCGCCLNGRATGALATMGLGGLTARLGAVPLSAVRLGAGGTSAEVPLPAGGAAVSRTAFDAALIMTAESAGVAFAQRTAAALHPPDGSAVRRVKLSGDDGETAVEARLVLSADGLAGRLLGEPPPAEAGSRMGAGTVLPPEATADYGPELIHMAAGRGGYVGLVRLEDGSLDVAAAFNPEAVRASGGPGRLASAVLGEAGFPGVRGIDSADWRGTPLLTRRPTRPVAERVLVVGDAAGYVEPFTGEGMAWALASALAVGPVAERAVRRGWSPSVAAEWSAAHRRTVLERQAVCRLAAAALRRPLLTGLAVRLLSVVPGLAGPFARELARR
jgi:flavin-dependent dehydrogenase